MSPLSPSSCSLSLLSYPLPPPFLPLPLLPLFSLPQLTQTTGKLSRPLGPVQGDKEPTAGHPDTQGTFAKTIYVGKGNDNASGLLRQPEFPLGSPGRQWLSCGVSIITIVGTSESTAPDPDSRLNSQAAL